MWQRDYNYATTTTTTTKRVQAIKVLGWKIKK